MNLKNKHPQLFFIPKNGNMGIALKENCFFIDKLKNKERYDFVVEVIRICVILLHNYERNN